MKTILSSIVKDKKLWLSERIKQQPLASFIDQITPSLRSFYLALNSTKTVFILECKKASPSKGLIRPDFDPESIAATYQPYASAISVLTDEKYFQGSFDFLTLVSNKVPQPILCKDFIIDVYQIYLARYYQADAILLMLSILDDEQYLEFAKIAHQLNMGVLTEVSNQQELARAIKLKAQVVGINNRDLRDLSIDLNRTKQLAPQLPQNVTVISESGIHNHQQVNELRYFANGFLVGSALMSEHNLKQAIRKIIFGTNKICGLTRVEDAKAAYQAGAIYGGIIFASCSPRCISPELAQTIIHSTPLNWVGIFTDNTLEQIIYLAKQLGLVAIQLHRNLNQTDISALREHLPEKCQIWLALSLTEQQPDFNLQHINYYLFDNGQGGSGQTFDWNLLTDLELTNVVLAGGLSVNNVQAAQRIGCFALDFNSGLEHAPGIKDHAKISQLFNTICLNKRSTRKI